MEIYPRDIILRKETNESRQLFFQASNSRHSQNNEALVRWQQMQISALEVASSVNPFQDDLPVGVVVPTLDAVGWSNGHRNVDIRPRLVDKSSGEARLIDSGAQISATARKPGDK